MTRVLISVRNAEEARTALAGGAHLIDVKEPRRGPLGAADAETVEQVVAAVGGRRPISVALGELHDLAAFGVPAVPQGVSYCKLGMSGMAQRGDWPSVWGGTLARLPRAVRPVAVVYADGHRCGCPLPARIVAQAERLGCAAVLVDTFAKQGGRLTDLWQAEEIARFVQSAKSRGMLAVVAGSIGVDLVAAVLAAEPDYVAVRGAACVGGREGRVDLDRVRTLVDAVGRLPSRQISRIA